VLNGIYIGPKRAPLIAAKLHLPKVHKSGGAAIDMWIKVRSNSLFPISQHPTPFYAYALCPCYCVLASVLNILFCTQAKELDTNTHYYLELLSKGVGKPKEELAEFLKGPRGTSEHKTRLLIMDLLIRSCTHWMVLSSQRCLAIPLPSLISFFFVKEFISDFHGVALG
jgi:hypothetical protein